MEALAVFLLIIGTLVVLDIAALRGGVDSRPGSTDRRRPITPTPIEVR